MGYTIAFQGLNELQQGLIRRSHLEAAKTVVMKNGSSLQEQAQRNAPVDTGTLKRSIGLEIKDSGLTAVSGPTVHYGEYVERGTRFMEAQPYMKPALHTVSAQFNADLKKLVR